MNIFLDPFYPRWDAMSEKTISRYCPFKCRAILAEMGKEYMKLL
jgi:hypothetical protein